MNNTNNIIFISEPEQVTKAHLIIKDNGYESFIVGGCVRDSLLYQIPKDWDMCTNMKPEKIIECFKNKGYKVIETGLQHGTVTVIIDSLPIEITTYRVESDYEDNRHPKNIQFASSLTEDLSRRDFTINAMAYSPGTGLIDPFNGYEDLIKNKVIKCVGNAEDRFNEDALRILRALRFASKLGFDIEKSTSKAIGNCYKNLQNISAERIHDELTKSLQSKNFGAIYKNYKYILGLLIPEFLLCSIDDTLDMMTLSHNRDEITEWTIFLSPFIERFPEISQEKYLTEPLNRILRRFKFDNHTREKILELCKYYTLSFENMSSYFIKKILNSIGHKQFQRMMTIKLLQSEYRLQGLKNSLSTLNTVITKNEPYRMNDLVIDGCDVMKALNTKSGKPIGKALEFALDQVQSNPSNNNKDVLINLIKEQSQYFNLKTLEF